MSNFERQGINVAIVATPKSPLGGTGGSEVFTGTLANVLSRQGFPVRVYGQDGASFPFETNVRYIQTGPTTDRLMRRDGIGERRAVNETSIATPLILARDLTEDTTKKWVVIDNDTTTLPLAPFLNNAGIPHIFIQHPAMTPNSARMYGEARRSGSKLVAIADSQREDVTRSYGQIHDVTIKNGIEIFRYQPTLREYVPGEEIHVGTLSRIEPTDSKGIRLAGMAVTELRRSTNATLSIAGPLPDRGLYDAVIAPFEDAGTAIYVGEKLGDDKVQYLADLHVGAALSNPGNWNEQEQRFEGSFREGNSLSLAEMIYCGTVPVSSDSGGAEPLRDAGLENFIIPLQTIPDEGMDAFVTLASRKMREAAYSGLSAADLRSRVRTADQMGEEYAAYIMSLV